MNTLKAFKTIVNGLIITTAVASAAATYGEPLTPAGSASDVTLREAAKGRFLVGTAVNSQQVADQKLGAFIARQFDCITAENAFKPDELEAEKGKFTFTAADSLVAFAQAHQMKVVGHNLCWHNQTPAWMFQDESKKPLSREEALANLKNHIDNVVGHFKGKVIGWDVVNEAISDIDSEYLRDTPAWRAIGDDYIAKAFEFAHAADPDAELYYNDYANENPGKREKTIKLIRDLKQRGLRIDAVGLQCHFMLQYPDAPEALDSAITAYRAEGVKVMVTELDLEVLPRATAGADITATEKTGLNPYPESLPADVAETEAKFYERAFHAILKHPGDVSRVTFWGIHDGTSWLNDWPVRGRKNYPLLFDRTLQPKPAFETVIKALAESPTGSAAK